MRPKKAKDNFDDEYRELVEQVPELVQLLETLGNRIENFDIKQPVMVMEQIKGDFASFSEIIDDRGTVIGEAFAKILEGQGEPLALKREFEQTIRKIKREAAKDSRYSLLLKLMRDADQTVPFISYIVFARHSDAERSLPAQCRPLPFIEAAEMEVGEARAEAVLSALEKTFEGLYRPYLITMVQLWYLKQGRVPPQPGNSGNLVNDLSEWLIDYPGLVDPDAAWLRNAGAHQSYTYLPDQDALKLQDKKGGERTISTSDLLDRVKQLYQISGVTIQLVGQLYLLRDILSDTGILDEFIKLSPAALSGDPQKLLEANEAIMRKLSAIFAPMQAFFASHGIQ